MKQINRLKVVLIEQNKTGKWSAETLRKNKAAISYWYTNEMQPLLEALASIANVLNLDVKYLLVSIKNRI